MWIVFYQHLLLRLQAGSKEFHIDITFTRENNSRNQGFAYSLSVQLLFCHAILSKESRLTWQPSCADNAPPGEVSSVGEEENCLIVEKMVDTVDKLYAELERQQEEVNRLCVALGKPEEAELSVTWSELGEKSADSTTASAESADTPRLWMDPQEWDNHPVHSFCIYNTKVEELY